MVLNMDLTTANFGLQTSKMASKTDPAKWIFEGVGGIPAGVFSICT